MHFATYALSSSSRAKMIKSLSFAFIAVALGTTCTTTQSAEPQAEVVLRSELAFQPLNPARRDANPKAGVRLHQAHERGRTGVRKPRQHSRRWHRHATQTGGR